MPDRLKQRRGSLHELSVTMTRLAPAARHSRTSSATTCGSVLAACSGSRSQPTLGLTTTTSPVFTNRPIPPTASTARRRLAAESAPRAAAAAGKLPPGATRQSGMGSTSAACTRRL